MHFKKKIFQIQWRVCVSVCLAVSSSLLLLLLLTCRPAEPPRPSSTRLNPPPSEQLSSPSPAPPGWHHHGGTHGPPHLFPITSLPKPSTKETPNGYEMERNNLGPWENISEWSCASSGPAEVLICVWSYDVTWGGGRGRGSGVGLFRQLLSGCEILTEQWKIKVQPLLNGRKFRLSANTCEKMLSC